MGQVFKIFSNLHHNGANFGIFSNFLLKNEKFALKLRKFSPKIVIFYEFDSKFR